MHEFLTIGYGNLKPDDFMDKVREHKITHFIDVRRDTVGRIRSYATGKRIAATLSAGNSIMALRHYIHVPEMGRPKDMALADYTTYLMSSLMWRPIVLLSGYVWGVVKEGGVPALLCAEGTALEDHGTTRCQRVYVAKAIVEYLGSEWRIRHV